MVVNACFVVYQSFASAALNVFACMKIDSGDVSGSTPSYYANFQQVCCFLNHVQKLAKELGRVDGRIFNYEYTVVIARVHSYHVCV